jgi:hypothetical protein
VKKSSVLTALNFLALPGCNLHDVQLLLVYFAAVLKGCLLDLTLLTQGPSLHHPTRESAYFQCNVSKYEHVQGLKLHKICQAQAQI